MTQPGRGPGLHKNLQSRTWPRLHLMFCLPNHCNKQKDELCAQSPHLPCPLPDPSARPPWVLEPSLAGETLRCFGGFPTTAPFHSQQLLSGLRGSDATERWSKGQMQAQGQPDNGQVSSSAPLLSLSISPTDPALGQAGPGLPWLLCTGS